ncbi:MAG: YitT family protein [Ruminococcaceae bacterium]|nr:YitT family protein [Oscillospiraceae bacterium]
MRLSRENLLPVLKNLLLVTVGTLILAFGTAVFILPVNLICGGISGFAIIFKLLLPFEWVTVDLIVFCLTWLLFFVGLFVLGKGFAAKTLLSAIVYPPAISLFLRLTEPSVMNGFFCLSESTYGELALMLCAAAGGLCVGVGCALTFLGGGSTGGVDILAFTICKFFPRLKSSTVIFALDALTVLLGVFVIGDLVLTMLGVFSAFISAGMVDKVFLGGRAAFVAYVVTDRAQEINASVIERLDRTTTILDATGGFSNRGKKMLVVSFTMSQYNELLGIVTKEDPRAFLIVHRAHEINGEGWGAKQ